VEFPGDDHIPWVGDGEAILREIQAFATSTWQEVEPERVLATVMFTDIVGVTEKAAELGDNGWKRLLEEHHARISAHLGRFRGVEVDTAGDGFFATFDGPARAINCARAVVGSVADLGIQVRVGLHCGECERIAGKAGGVAVNIGARVSGAARPNEILVSQTVKDLVAGSGISFGDRGEHELKGVPDRWRLYRVVS